MPASARAVSDGAKHAWIDDVIVRADCRRRGLGRALLGLLLDHPSVRGARKVWLNTKDAQTFYVGFGFVEAAHRHALMCRDEVRSPSPSGGIDPQAPGRAGPCGQ